MHAWDLGYHPATARAAGNDYKLAWLLVLPAWNYAKEKAGALLARLRGEGGGEEEVVEEEGEEGAEGDESAMLMAQEGEA